MTSPALNTPCRSAERAALDKAVKALQEIKVGGFGYGWCQDRAADALASIAKLVPDAVPR